MNRKALDKKTNILMLEYQLNRARMPRMGLAHSRCLITDTEWMTD